MLLNGSLPLCLGIVAINTQDLELTLILLVVLLHLRHTLDTPDTPRTPEVDDHILATEAGKREWLAIDVIQSEVRSLYTGSLNHLSLLLHLSALLGTFEDRLIVCLHSTVLDVIRHQTDQSLLVLDIIQLVDEKSDTFLIRMLLGISKKVGSILLPQRFHTLIYNFFDRIAVAVIHIVRIPFPERFDILVSLTYILIHQFLFLIEFTSLDIDTLSEVTLHLNSLTRNGKDRVSLKFSPLDDLLVTEINPLRLIKVLGVHKLLFLNLNVFRLSSNHSYQRIRQPLYVTLDLKGSALSHRCCRCQHHSSCKNHFLHFELCFIFYISTLTFIHTLLYKAFFIPHTP